MTMQGTLVTPVLRAASRRSGVEHDQNINFTVPCRWFACCSAIPVYSVSKVAQCSHPGDVTNITSGVDGNCNSRKFEMNTA